MLARQCVVPKKLLEAGFNSQQPIMKDALADIFKGVFRRMDRMNLSRPWERIFFKDSRHYDLSWHKK
ncbi:MAG: DUF1731 domain-containing protein [Candidatus Omnitrophica bacterium]|nr:DUF1731 domain-containing protein [Candidatus Omnitrophota bacterium]